LERDTFVTLELHKNNLSFVITKITKKETTYYIPLRVITTKMSKKLWWGWISNPRISYWLIGNCFLLS